MVATSTSRRLVALTAALALAQLAPAGPGVVVGRGMMGLIGGGGFRVVVGAGVVVAIGPGVVVGGRN